MQKKIIALAVAGLASTAAFAQTNVQIYGIVDYGYSYRWDELSNNGLDGNSAFNGGQASGSRLGFKGTEDLGNGLKALFLVEQGLAIDTNSGDNDATSNATGTNRSINFTRQAYAGLTGNFGTLIGGRLYTPHFNMWANVLDPFAAGTVGQYRNAMGGALGGDVVRVDNAVAYVSPNFGGLTVTAAYSNNMSTNESNVRNGDNTNIYALYGQYAAGGLTVVANYHYGVFQGDTGTAAVVDTTYNLTLGGAYDFKSFKLSGAFAYNETDLKAGGASNLEVMNYFLGLTVPVGKVDLKASILYSDGDQQGDATQYAIGANYNLSKRTDIYTAYSYIDADDQRMLGRFATGGVGDAGNSGLGYGQGVQLGMRHKF